MNVSALNNRKFVKRLILFIIGFLVGFYGLAPMAKAQAPMPPKIKITSADQLPRRTYTLSTTDLLKNIEDKAEIDRLALELQNNLLADLEKYDIEDKATLKAYYSSLEILTMRQFDYKKAAYYSNLQKDLATKEAEKLMSGVGLTSQIQAQRETKSTSGDAFEKAYAANLYQNLSSLPFEKIRDKVEARKGQLEYFSKDLIIGSIQAQLQPMVNQMGENVDESIAFSLVSLHHVLNYSIDLIDEQLSVYSRLLEENAENPGEKINIWTARNIDFPKAAAAELNTVKIAVWDTGVDMDVFDKENRFTNTSEKANTKDSDKNGFIDDIHGIAYDKDWNPNSSLLMSEKDLTYDVATLQKLTQGSMDLQANINSENASYFKNFMKNLKPDEMQTFIEDVTWYGTYSHGTHVAGITQAGNPAAQILSTRLEYSTKTIPDVPTKERALRTAQAYKDIVNYFKANDVKVVNMSWRYGSSFYEAALMANGVGEKPEARKVLANELFQIEKKALQEAFASAPGILFVCGSGNENNDADFQEYIPAGINLPNVITIGAVDSEGKKTSFTTEGKSIDFYANGFEIESFVPGGDRVKFSGTSMASPQVANLAGKLWSIHPELTVEQVITLIKNGATTSDEGVLLIHPKNSVVQLAQQLQAKGK